MKRTKKATRPPRFVRFDFPAGTSPEEVAKALRALAEKHAKTKSGGCAGVTADRPRKRVRAKPKK